MTLDEPYQVTFCGLLPPERRWYKVLPMSPIVQPLRPRRQRPHPPLAEVQVAEEERLLLRICRELGQLWPKFLVRPSMTAFRV